MARTERSSTIDALIVCLVGTSKRHADRHVEAPTVSLPARAA